METREEHVGQVTILTPQGVMDIATLPAFDARLTRLIESGMRALVWDLSGVRILPSTAAGFLIHAGRRLRDAGGRMALCGVGERVRLTLETMGVGGVFRQYPDSAAAAAALGERQPPPAQ